MISSATNSKIKHLQKLIRDRKYRYQQAQFVAEGYRQLEGAANILGLYFLAPIVKREMNSYFARIESGEIKKFK